MNRLHTLLAASVLALSTQAYTAEPATELTVATPSASTAPLKANSLENTVEWGFFTRDNFYGDGDVQISGLGSQGTSEAGYLVTMNNVLKGAKIAGVRIPIYDEKVITACKVNIYSSDVKRLLASQTVDVSKLVGASYNDVVFDTPFLLEDDIVVSYAITTEGFTDAAKFPIYFDSRTKVEGGMYVISGQSVVDKGMEYGALIMKLCLSDLDMPDYNVVFNPGSGYTQKASSATFNLTLESNSAKAVQNIDYTLSVAGGEPVECHANVNIKAGFNYTATIPVTFTTPAESGTYDVVLTVTKVNGVENSANISTTCSYNNLKRLIPRNVVMEEFTGTGCGFCTRGMAGMEKCRAKYGDRFVGIAYHLYGNGTDPMTPTAYPDLGWAGAPSCFLDRNGKQADPYYGTKQTGIIDDIEACMLVPPLVEVNADATLTEDFTRVKVNATVQALVEGTYNLDFILLADGLTGPKFIQHNYYSMYTADQLNITEEDPLFQYISGSIFGSSSCKPIYNDVAIAATYKYGSPTGGSLTLGEDETGTANATLRIPIGEDLLNAIRNAGYDLYAAVIALNPDGTVSNAVRVKVQKPSDGIEEITTGNEVYETARYSLDGRRLSQPMPGVNILRMSDGSSRKVVVE